jgi:hypothetical protein
LDQAGVVVGDPQTGIVNRSAEYLRPSYAGALLQFDLALVPPPG